MSHSPLPWSKLRARTLINIKGKNGEQICQIPSVKEADADLLLKAVNNHDSLVATIKACRDYFIGEDSGAADFVTKICNQALANAEK